MCVGRFYVLKRLCVFWDISCVLESLVCQNMTMLGAETLLYGVKQHSGAALVLLNSGLNLYIYIYILEICNAWASIALET